jgi:hypothetical protein
MNAKFVVAILASTVIAYFGGWLIFGIVFDDMYTSNVNPAANFLQRTEPMLWAVFIATLAWCILLTWVLQKTGNTGFKKGFLVGFFISFLIMVLFDLNLYAFWDLYPLKFIVTDIFIGSFFWGLIGSVSGLVLAFKKNAPIPTA